MDNSQVCWQISGGCKAQKWMQNNTAVLCYLGSAYGTREDRRITYTGSANLRAGSNKLALLSVAVGLPVSFLSLD